MSTMNFTSNTTFVIDWEPPEKVYPYPKDSAFRIIIFSIIFGLGAFAVISNLMFLITVIGEPSLRKTRLSVYLIDMAIIDIISSIGYIVFASMKVVALNPASEPFFTLFLDAFFTMFVLMVRNALQLLSSVLIICVAWERYKAVCRPFETMTSSSNLKRFVAIVVIGTIVLYVIFVAMGYFFQVNFFPVSLYTHSYCEQGTMDWIRYCYKDRYLVFDGVPKINYVLLAVDVMTLVVSMAVFYVIIRQIKQSPALGVTDRHQKEERKLTRMAFVNSLAFIVLVLLQDISTLLVIILAKSSFPRIGEFVYNLQGIWNLLNSVANPIIYNVFGTRYRQAMVKRFRPCMGGKREKRETNTFTEESTTTTATSTL